MDQGSSQFFFQAGKAMRRRPRGKCSHLQSDVYTAYLFRPNNILTGRYDRKKRKRKERRTSKN